MQSFIMLLVPAVLIPLWVNKVKRIEDEIKVYMSAYVQDGVQSHFHKDMKFGFMLIILMMVALAISIVTFVGLTIRAARREMYLCATLIKQMEETQQAQRKSMNKSTAFALANHDVRASLAGISGLIEMCRAHASPESELAKNLNHMESCTNDLLGILNSILDQSKIEEGKKQLEEEEFNMEGLLEDVVNCYYPFGALKNVDVLLDPCDGSVQRFSRVKGDRRELRRILSNLLHNAVKFTSEGHIALRVWARKLDQSYNLAPSTSKPSIGCVPCFTFRIDEASAELQALNRVKEDPNCVEFIFEVDDTGKGIPKEKQKSVFENYVQVNETSSSHGQAGTGLGLGIIQSLVRLMGGEISIIDKEIGEKGTCFRFNIFLIACDHPQAQEHQAFGVGYAREEDSESQLGGYISSDSYYHSAPSTNSITSQQKSETSNVILFIREEERSRVLQRFMMYINMKVHVVKRHEQLSPTLKNVKRKLISFQPYNSSSSGKSKDIPLSALDGTDDHDHITSFQPRRGRRLNSKSAFTRYILIIIDTSCAPFREISRAMAEFRKDFPKNVSLRVVWLEKPGLDEHQLPSTDMIMGKPLHGSRLYHVLRFLPEFVDAFLSTIVQDTKDEISTSRSKTHNTPVRSSSPPLVGEIVQQNVSVDVNGAAHSSKKPLTGKKILVVDDSELQLMICKTAVSKLGATIYTCGNGEQALAHVCEGLNDQWKIGPSTPSPPFDYILMDCEMAVMNGFEATKRIREEEARYGIRIPIIALTAHAIKEEIDKIFQAGMDFYLPKPLKSDELMKAIDYIEHRKV